MNKKIILVLFVLLNFACSDDEIKLDYPSTFVSTEIKDGDIRVFTKNGEIENKEVKNKFIDRYKIYLTNLEGSGEMGEMRIEFVDPETAEITINSNGTKQIKTVHKESKMIYLEDREVSWYTGVDLFEDYYEYLPFYYLIDDSRISSTAGGHDYVTELKRCNYLLKEGKKLSMPYLDIFLTNGYSLTSYRFINNSFKKGSFKYMANSDTLMVHNYNLNLVEME